MDAPTIDHLSTLDPASKIPRIRAGKAREMHKTGPIRQITAERFMSKYGRLEFGFYIASQFAHHQVSFPAVMEGKDCWVYKAYLMLLDPYKYFDKYIAEAYHMAHYVRSHPDFGSVLRAMLLSVDKTTPAINHIHQVSRDTGLSPQTVEAFEVLFYNVLDRRDDAIFMSQHVYPSTRLVEFDENYVANSTQSEILLRAGYNHRNLDLTKYLAGIGDQSYLKNMAASDNREADLTKFIMGNGLILTHANLLNQRSTGMNRASTLLAASRQSGAVIEEPAMSSIAPLFNEQFKLATAHSREGIRQQMIADSGQLVEV